MMRCGNGNNSLPRHPAVLWSRMKLRWPALIWMAAAAGAYLLHHHSGRAGSLQGVVEAAHEVVAPLERARVAACHVVVGQRVEAGTVVAVLDASLLEAEWAVKRLEIEREFETDLLRLAAERRDTVQRHAFEGSERRVLEGELARMEDLVGRRLLDVQQVVEYRTRYHVLSEAVERHAREVAELEEAITELLARREDMQARWTGETEEGWLARIREEYTLRVRHDGVISAVQVRPGQVVDAGWPVVTLLVDQAPRVIGFLPEWDPQPVAMEQRMFIVRHAGGPTLEGRVVSISPEMRTWAAEVSPVPGRIVRGREFVVEVLGEADLLPGEAVILHGERPWWDAWLFWRRGSGEAPL